MAAPPARGAPPGFCGHTSDGSGESGFSPGEVWPALQERARPQTPLTRRAEEQGSLGASRSWGRMGKVWKSPIHRKPGFSRTSLLWRLLIHWKAASEDAADIYILLFLRKRKRKKKAVQVNKIPKFLSEKRSGFWSGDTQSCWEKSPGLLVWRMFVLDRSGLILSLVHADLTGWERASRQRARHWNTLRMRPIR